MKPIDHELLMRVMVQLADTLKDDFDPDEFLQTVMDRTTELSGVDAVGMLMAGADGQLHFMAASDDRSRRLELLAVSEDEGPCRDCYHHAHPVRATNLRTSGRRWPAFTPAALSAGFVSVHAFPLRLRHDVIGSMGLFGARPSTLTSAEVQIVQAVADIATIGILHARTVQHAEERSKQLQTALDSRVSVEQAKATIAYRYAVSIDDAFELLRAYCRTTHQRMHDVAVAIVADPVNGPELRPGELRRG